MVLISLFGFGLVVGMCDDRSKLERIRYVEELALIAERYEKVRSIGNVSDNVHLFSSLSCTYQRRSYEMCIHLQHDSRPIRLCICICITRLAEESTTQPNADRLDLGVVGKSILAEFSANTRLLEATEWHLV